MSSGNSFVKSHAGMGTSIVVISLVPFLALISRSSAGVRHDK